MDLDKTWGRFYKVVWGIGACSFILKEHGAGQVAAQITRSYLEKRFSPATRSEILNGVMDAWADFKAFLCQKPYVIILIPAPSVIVFILVNLVSSFC